MQWAASHYLNNHVRRHVLSDESDETTKTGLRTDQHIIKPWEDSGEPLSEKILNDRDWRSLKRSSSYDCTCAGFYYCVYPYDNTIVTYFDFISFLLLSCLIDGAECNAQLIKPGQSIAARLLAVIADLEQAHATFQRREKEDGTSVILNP